MSLPFATVLGDLSLVRPLGRAGLPVAAVSHDPSSTLRLSRYVRELVVAPSVVRDADGAVTALAAWGRAQASPPVLFYQGDHDLLALSTHRERLAPIFRFLLPPHELVLDLVDKLRFAGLAARAGLPVPATATLRRGDPEVPKQVAEWRSFPCVLKPAVRAGWFGSPLQRTAGGNQKALRIESRRELEALLPLILDHGADFILQAAVEGGEERIVSYHAYVRPGGVVGAELSGKKVRTSPRLYGLSSCVEITRDPEVLRLGREVVERLGFFGVVKIDFKSDVKDGRLFMLEANPRFSLWHHPAAVAGTNFPALYYTDCVAPGSARAPRRIRSGVRWMSERADLVALREYRAAGEASLWGWLYQWATAQVTEDVNLRDPLPGLAALKGVLLRRLRQRLTRPSTRLVEG